MDGFSVDRLFRSVKEIELVGRKIKVRALSDVERQGRYRQALLARVSALEALKKPDTDEYRIVYSPLEEASDEELRATLFAFKRRELVLEADEKIQPEYLPFPDNADRSEEGEVLQKRKEQEQVIQNKRADYIKEKLEAYEAVLKETARDKLLTEARKVVSENVAENAFQDEYMHQTLWMALDGQFTLEEVKGMSVQAKAALMQAFSEVNDLDPLHSPGPSATASPEASLPSSASVGSP